VAQAVKVHLKKIASDNVAQGLGGDSMGSTEEPERKRRHLNHHHRGSPLLKKPAVISASDEKKVSLLVGLFLHGFLIFCSNPGELSFSLANSA